jgi:protein FRA10AC1
MTDFKESDLEVLKEYHQFVRDDQYDEEHANDWKIRLARRYHDQLYKEYALVDLTHYQAGLIGLRWRTEDEVVLGKGHDFCGTLNCSSMDRLNHYELPFGYQEHGQEKAELVKVLVCKKCAKKLKYYLDKQRENHLLQQQNVSHELQESQPSKKKLKT